MKIHLFAGLALATGLAAGAAHAEATLDGLAALKIDAVPCRFHDTELEQADRDRAFNALTAMQAQNTAAVEAMMPDLRSALARAPDAPARPELCGATLEIYSDDVADLVKINAVLAGRPELAALTPVLKGAMPYGSLGFIVGWVEYEHADYASAERDFARGLRNAPDDVNLEAQYVLTLCKLKRPQDGLAAADGFLAGHPDLSDPDHAAMLRKRGHALVDLNRLDDAEAAYRQSLTLDPGNDIALSELDYIQRQRASH
ncbi:MAG: hypothetical protein WDN06_01850 [Asticcacaulis sp.]